MSSSSASSFVAVVDLRRRVEVGFFLLEVEKGEDILRRREEGFWMREAEVEEEVMRKFDMVVVEVGGDGGRLTFQPRGRCTRDCYDLLLEFA